MGERHPASIDAQAAARRRAVRVTVLLLVLVALAIYGLVVGTDLVTGPAP
jgi:hypothetical protein